LHTWWNLPPVGVQQRDRHGGRSQVRHYRHELPGIYQVLRTDQWRLHHAQARQACCLSGIGAIDHNGATHGMQTPLRAFQIFPTSALRAKFGRIMHDAMLVQIGQRRRRAVDRQIRRAGKIAHLHRADRTSHQLGVTQKPDPQYTIKPFMYEVHLMVSGTDAQLQRGVLRQELRQPRDDQSPGQCGWQVDAQASTQTTFDGLEHGLQVLGIFDQSLAAPKKLFAVSGKSHLTCGPLQQSRAHLHLKLLHRCRNAAFGQAQLVGRLRKAAKFCDANEDA